MNSQNSCEIELSKLHPLRNVSQEGYGASGNFYSEKNGRVVNYESYGEFFLYQLLEQSALISSYVEQPFSIPYALGQISANYYPDVLTEFKDGRLVCIETKDPRRLADACTLAKAGAATRFLLEKNIVYCLVTSRLSSLKDIINEGHSALDDALLPIIDSVGFVGWSDVRNITSEGPLSRNAIASFILRNRLFHSKAPFRIRRCSEGETCQLFGSDLFN